MKAQSIVFTPKCQIVFEPEDIMLLMKLSAMHYDALCRGVGQVGGFLFGLNNVYVVGEPLAVAASGSEREGVKLNFHKIDTLCKILEIAHYANKDKYNNFQEHAMTLTRDLRDCLHLLNSVAGLSQEIR